MKEGNEEETSYVNSRGVKMETIEILKLTSDTLFKAFMMSKHTNRLKARFIHLVTGIDEELLLHAEYQSVELPVRHKKNKVYRTDIVVKVDKHLLNIEMNADYYPEYKVKNSRYMNVIASESFETGEKYDKRFVIQINIDDFDAYGLDELIYEFRFMEVKHHILEDENYASYHINLSKIEDLCYTSDERTELVNILKIFKATSEEELDSLRGEVYMDEAIDEIKRICKDKNIIGLYNAEKVANKVMNNRLDYAKQQGYDEGEEAGIEKGKEKRNIEIVERMLENEIPDKTIMHIANITQEQLEQYKQILL